MRLGIHFWGIAWLTACLALALHPHPLVAGFVGIFSLLVVLVFLGTRQDFVPLRVGRLRINRKHQVVAMLLFGITGLTFLASENTQRIMTLGIAVVTVGWIVSLFWQRG